MTAYQAVKQHCVECMNKQSREVRNCKDINCTWYSWRHKKQPGSTLKAIRKYCLEECVGLEEKGVYEKVRDCNPRFGCALHPFRMGKNPNPKKLTEKQKKEIVERLTKARKARSTRF